MDKISVIIPSYNRVDLLDRCILSLLNQTYLHFDIYIVDSSDEKENIIALKQKYIDNKKIHFIFDTRHNPSIQRNIGVNIAFLESDPCFVTFVDSDDMVCKTYLEDLYLTQSRYHCDLVSTLLLSSTKDSDISHLDNQEIKENVVSRENAIIQYFKNSISHSVSGKLYGSNLLKKVAFDENISFNEDYDFTFRILLNANKIVLSSYKGYLYWKGDSNSLTRKTFLTNEKIISMLVANLKIAKDDLSLIQSKQDRQRIKDLSMELLAENFLSAFPRLNISFKSPFYEQYSSIMNDQLLKQAINIYHPRSKKEIIKKKLFLFSPKIYRFALRFYYLFGKTRYSIAPRE